MEVRGADHAADEVLATTTTPEPASGVPQVSVSPEAVQEPVAAGEGEQDQGAPAEVDDDELQPSSRT